MFFLYELRLYFCWQPWFMRRWNKAIHTWNIQIRKKRKWKANKSSKVGLGVILGLNSFTEIMEETGHFFQKCKNNREISNYVFLIFTSAWNAYFFILPKNSNSKITLLDMDILIIHNNVRFSFIQAIVLIPLIMSMDILSWSSLELFSY